MMCVNLNTIFLSDEKLTTSRLFFITIQPQQIYTNCFHTGKKDVP